MEAEVGVMWPRVKDVDEPEGRKQSPVEPPERTQPADPMISAL